MSLTILLRLLVEWRYYASIVSIGTVTYCSMKATVFFCSEYGFNTSEQAALDAEGRQSVSHSISTLLIRNLSDVFGESDPMRRRAALDELWNEDGVFYDPNKGVYRGRDEIDHIAGALRATHPDFQYQPISEPEELGNGGRVRWVSGTPGQAPAYGGTDFLIARDGRIAALYLFFDKLP